METDEGDFLTGQTAGELYYLLDPKTRIIAAPEVEAEANYLSTSLHSRMGRALTVRLQQTHSNKFVQTIILDLDTALKEEAYILTIDPVNVRLTGGSARGLFYGIQSLLQLLDGTSGPVLLPTMEIRDEPQFAHRGMLLDCCRHFWPVEVVKQYIDLLARYKMNVLHWHLTEDQGWRLEIDRYPKLTEVGGWRTEADGSNYGGFYTQEDVKDIVAYAASRHVTIIPEIEMPGHSLAALAAYPELACTPGPFEVTHEWGVFKDVYCAGSEATFSFLENVLTEVMELFPGKYIHIGGDECPKFRWEHCDRCQQRIRDEGLHDEHELHAYFIQRIERFLNANGRQLIGWDEILEGGLSTTATVQSWRGMAGGKAAAEQGNFAIMSPTSHCYLDYGLDAIDLERIYHFDPVPEGLDPEQANYILGGECNMWTEHVPTKAALDAKVLPRMIGLAEALWSPEKDFNGFRHRLQQHYAWLRAQGFDFGFETVPIAFETQARPNGVNVHVTLADSGLRARFTTDASDPEPNSPLWQQDSTFTTNTTLKMSASMAGRNYPEVFELPVFVHSALQRPVSFQPNYSPYYTAGGVGALTDGVGGTLDFRDGHWQGYQGENLVAVVDLGAAREVREVFANFYQYNNAWIFAPRAMRVSTSLDGQHFDPAGTGLPTSAPEDKGQFIERLGTSFASHSARYVKLEAENIGTCPPWHDAAGSPAWLFIDEIRIE